MLTEPESPIGAGPIRVSWQDFIQATEIIRLMVLDCCWDGDRVADRRGRIERPDTRLMAGNDDLYVSHGRLEGFGYVSHGRFLRVSWQDFFPKSLLYKPFPILQNTKTVV